MKNRERVNFSGLRMFRQSGVSLVEIMVALVLSLVLLAGVGRIYVGSKQTYRVQDGQSRLQENGRYAIDLLTKDVRETGYQGCRPMGTVTPNVIALVSSGTDFSFTQATAITGNEGSSGSWSPTLAATLNNVITGTDVITVQFASACGGTPVTASTSTSVTIPATNTCGVGASSNCGAGTGSCKGDMLVLADCQNVDVFRADTVSPSSATNPTTITINGTNNSAANLSKPYAADNAELMLFNSNTYFIRLNPNNEPSLFRLDNTTAMGGNNPVELVEGIENMQILYGVDTDSDGTPNQFMTADLVPPNWAQVVSVQAILTARSVGESADYLTTLPNPARSYNGNNSYVDSRLLKTFSATISLRNREP